VSLLNAIPRMKIGVRLESLGLPLRRALLEAQRMGVSGVQVDAVGDLAPDQLSQTGRREFRNLLRSHDLEMTAVGCPMRRGLDTAENLEARIDYVRKVEVLSFELGPRIVIVQAGRIREDPAAPEMALLRESLLALGHHGDRTGAILALETGLESGETLAKFLAGFDSGGLGVNYDPANLLHGFDPYVSVQSLGRLIVHAHAKDARSASASRSAGEVPLGHGDIDWIRLLGVLEEVEYCGWLVIEREGGDQRVIDVANGVKFLRRLVR
jgi:L-ribulose-5-phosphate 3-epimerase